MKKFRQSGNPDPTTHLSKRVAVLEGGIITWGFRGWTSRTYTSHRKGHPNFPGIFFHLSICTA